jgi:hypothetical protein
MASEVLNIDYNKNYVSNPICINCKRNECDEHSINIYHQKKHIKETSKQIIEYFIHFNELILLAQMQSGKSDVIKRIIELFNNNKEYFEKILKIENIFIIILASDTGLKQNSQKEFYNFISYDHILHIDDVNTITEYLINPKKKYKMFSNLKQLVSAIKSNCLIIVDEAHSDQEVKSTMDNFRKALNIEFNNFTNTIKYLNVSATAYEHILTTMPKVILKPTSDYYGLRKMLESEKVYQSYELTIYDEYIKFIDDLLCKSELAKLPKQYIIVRVQSDAKEQMVRHNIKLYPKTKDFLIESYNMSSKNDINDILKIVPTNTTFIIIKGRLTKGHRIIKENIMAVSDTPNNGHTHTTVQGLIGRMCGYNANPNALIYCDIEKVMDHYEWIKSGYNDKNIPLAKYIMKSGEIKKSSIFGKVND